MRSVSAAVRMSLFAVFVLAVAAGRASAIIFTPEIDPGSMGTALALLAGGICMLTGRRSR